MTLNELHLSVIDQTIYRGYVRNLQVFSFPRISEATAAIEILRGGLSATIQRFPFLAGTIAPEVDNVGRLAVRYPDSKCITANSQIMDDIFSANLALKLDMRYFYDDLVKAGMPHSRLPNHVFCPKLLKNHPGLEDPFAEKLTILPKQPIPVLAAQATFIPGGLVLSVFCHHSVVDGTGLSMLYKDWSDNVKGKKNVPDTVEPTNHSDYRHTIDVLPRNFWYPSTSRLSHPTHCPELTTTDKKPSTRFLRSGSLDPTAKIFVISADRIATLRDEINKLARSFHDDKGKNRSVTAFSTLAALIWIYATRARGPKLKEKEIETSTIGIAADHRKRVGEPFLANYLGNLALYTTAKFQVSDILQQLVIVPHHILPLAFAIAESISEMTRDWVMDRINYLGTIKDPTTVTPSFTTSNGPDLFITSWQHIGADCVWDIPGAENGKADYFRKPFSKADGGIIVLPRRKGENVPYEVLVGLESEDMAWFEEEMREWCIRVVE